MYDFPAPRIGYVVKRYPRYSETFIVNEILAHEQAGLDLEIFSLRPPCDTHFQASIARVRAPVTYLDEPHRLADLWPALGRTAAERPGLGELLARFEREEPRDVIQALQLAQLLRRRGITHLHAHFASSATAVARMAASVADIPYTFTAHAKDIFHESVDAADLAAKMRDAAGVVTVSAYNAQFLKDRFGDDADRVVRLYNGLDLAEFPFRDPVDRPPTIAGVGRLIEKKGFEDLIDACALLAAEGVDFECLIAGGGEREEALRRRIADRRLGDFVRLLGPLPMPGVVRLMQRAAVFAAPCVVGEDGNRDGLPTVILEAMALGTPCVSTDVTGIPEVLTDRETGLLVPQHDPRSLADATQRLLENIPFRQRLARQARSRIEELFDIHRNTRRLRAMFTHAGVNAPMQEVAA